MAVPERRPPLYGRRRETTPVRERTPPKTTVPAQKPIHTRQPLAGPAHFFTGQRGCRSPIFCTSDSPRALHQQPQWCRALRHGEIVPLPTSGSRRHPTRAAWRQADPCEANGRMSPRSLLLLLKRLPLLLPAPPIHPQPATIEQKLLAFQLFEDIFHELITRRSEAPYVPKITEAIRQERAKTAFF